MHDASASKPMITVRPARPVRALKDFKENTLHAGMAYVVVGERGYYPSGLKKRVITEIFRFDRREL